MTGATDGDVERALAAMGAAPLRYHSFGLVNVRPLGAQPAPSSPLGTATSPLVATTPVSSQIRVPRSATRVATVFPLLGLAIPEALQIDVEPEWPTMAFHRDPGVLPPIGAGLAPEALSGARFAPPAAASPFTLPAWLEPSSHGPVATPYVTPRTSVFSAEPTAVPPPQFVQPAIVVPPPTIMSASTIAPTVAPRGGDFTLPPWLEPSPPVPTPALPAAPSFSPFPDDSEQTVRHSARPGSFPSWLEPLPPGVPVSNLPSWQVDPPAGPQVAAPVPPAPPLPEPVREPIRYELPAALPQEPGWLERAMAVPSPLPPAAPVEPPMFRVPPVPAPSPTPPGDPAARKPLAEMFRSLGARPPSPS